MLHDIEAPSLAEQREQSSISSSSNGKIHYVTTLAHLATFGILGVLVRYGLEQLFSPSIARVTDYDSVAFIDLPANMLGSFFMGWLGVVLKQHIVTFSEHLALGLTTGLLGSITTFASWSQSVIKMVTEGYWLRGLCGYLLGMELAMMSFLIGIDTASIFLGFLEKRHGSPSLSKQQQKQQHKKVWLELVTFLSIGICLWGSACLLAYNAPGSRKRLWIACCLAPLGVWIRWWLSGLNGRGLWNGHLKWFPTGTFAANISACIAEFVLSALQFLIPSAQFAHVSGGVQIGLMGCLSTVSTLVAEVYVLHQGMKRWRSYAYASITILAALVTGLLSFSTVVWTRHSSLQH